MHSKFISILIKKSNRVTRIIIHISKARYRSMSGNKLNSASTSSVRILLAATNNYSALLKCKRVDLAANLHSVLWELEVGITRRQQALVDNNESFLFNQRQRIRGAEIFHLRIIKIVPAFFLRVPNDTGEVVWCL